jgi:hypothetical protein
VRRRVLKVFLVMVLGAICSLAVAGMIAFLLTACGVHGGWLLALLSLPPGIALGVFIALPLSGQFLIGGADTHRRRATEANEEDAP